jgi:hypothetical protein
LLNLAYGIHGQAAYNSRIAMMQEVIMFDSSAALVLALALFVCAALALATRYHTDHPVNDLRHWFSAHHWLDRMRHRH